MTKGQDLIFNQEQIALLCHRRFGVGADGLMILRHSDVADFEMIYYNSDGNLSSMCGNGGRCISQFYFDQGYGTNHVTFLAVDGIHEAWTINGEIKLKMSNITSIDARDTETYVLNTGSPHYVHFVNDLDLLKDIFDLGKSIRYNEEFKESGINVNLSYKLEDNIIHMATYERGVEDETYSCGTGVIAAAIAHITREGLYGHQKILVNTKGGLLHASFNKVDNDHVEEIHLQGPAQFVYSGELADSLLTQ